MKHLMFIKNFCSKWGIYFLIIFFTFIYAFAAIIRHNHFESFAFDLGIFDQAIWLYSRFKIPYSTIKGMIILGDHFTPSLAFLAPFYWIYSDVKTLLFLQALIIGLGALPIFLIAKKFLKNILLSLIISFSYLMYFGLQNALLFDFHEIVILTGLIPWLIYVAIEKKWLAYFLLLLIIIGLKEDAPIITASIGLFFMVKFREYRIGLITIIISVISFFLITKYLIPKINPAGFHYQPIIPVTPYDWWETFTYPPVKIKTLIVSFLPFLFLPIFSLSGLIPIFVHFLEHFPGKELIGRWDIYLHYRAPLASFMAIGTIFGISSIFQRLKNQRNKVTANLLLAGSIVMMTLFTQYFFHLPLNSLFKKAFYRKSPFMEDINSVIAKFPKNASLSTQNNIAPHVSHREKVFLFPQVKDTDYILLDLRENQPPNNFFPYEYHYSKINAFNLIKNKQYKIIEQKGEVYLLKKIYTSQTQF